MTHSRFDTPRRTLWPIVLRTLAALFLLATVVALMMPIGSIEADTGDLDKVVHVLLFVGVSVSLALLFRPLTAPILFALALALGAGSEVIQGFLGRDASWGDLLADAVGITLFLVVALFLRRRPANKRRYGRSATWLH